MASERQPLASLLICIAAAAAFLVSGATAQWYGRGLGYGRGMGIGPYYPRYGYYGIGYGFGSPYNYYLFQSPDEGGNATLPANVSQPLPNCIWHEDTGNCTADAAILTGLPDLMPNTTGGILLMGAAATSAVCHSHGSEEACAAGGCRWSNETSSCSLEVTELFFAPHFLCSDAPLAAAAIACYSLRSSADACAAAAPNCSYVPNTRMATAGGEAAGGMCVPGEVAQNATSVQDWYSNFTGFDPSVWGSCNSSAQLQPLLSCYLLPDQEQCGTVTACTWHNTSSLCLLQQPLLIQAAASSGVGPASGLLADAHAGTDPAVAALAGEALACSGHTDRPSCTSANTTTPSAATVSHYLAMLATLEQERREGAAAAVGGGGAAAAGAGGGGGGGAPGGRRLLRGPEEDRGW